jgi:hypothetical protein
MEGVVYLLAPRWDKHVRPRMTNCVRIISHIWSLSSDTLLSKENHFWQRYCDCHTISLCLHLEPQPLTFYFVYNIYIHIYIYIYYIYYIYIYLKSCLHVSSNYCYSSTYKMRVPAIIKDMRQHPCSSGWVELFRLEKWSQWECQIKHITVGDVLAE